MIPLLLALALAAAPDSNPRIHQFSALALDPTGAKVASVETSEVIGAVKDFHGVVVIRSVKDGAVLERIDPCTDCKYAGLAWSPTGEALAFVASDVKTHTASVKVAVGGAVHDVANIKGHVQTPRWSPGGERIAFLAVVGAHKEIGATQPGKAAVGEIGADTDEQRIMIALTKGWRKGRRGLPWRHLDLRIRLDPGRRGLRGHRRQGRW